MSLGIIKMKYSFWSTSNNKTGTCLLWRELFVGSGILSSSALSKGWSNTKLRRNTQCFAFAHSTGTASMIGKEVQVSMRSPPSYQWLFCEQKGQAAAGTKRSFTRDECSSSSASCIDCKANQLQHQIPECLSQQQASTHSNWEDIDLSPPCLAQTKEGPSKQFE